MFERRFSDLVIQRMDAGEELFKKILDDEEFSRVLVDPYQSDVCCTLRSEGS
ncbi:MAG: hypothetical protein F2754_16450 [Actinobacteria bacterium]|uniref:Unannotated protein n=1 Tax=freshwater metagenome TaxID=449393 RepID=A0A6J7FZV5_9ZZZZ|nr:hypothetical protein [Actinomycetota bacterium]MSW90819.1 hypothetical protein [Actinomycetota bacterium]MSX88975.1 hypothetical protein [Actinomycetota bacterium]MSY71201.1 hypothetical protein [Actinomycetota bacterium]